MSETACRRHGDYRGHGDFGERVFGRRAVATTLCWLALTGISSAQTAEETAAFITGIEEGLQFGTGRWQKLSSKPLTYSITNTETSSSGKTTTSRGTITITRVGDCRYQISEKMVLNNDLTYTINVVDDMSDVSGVREIPGLIVKEYEAVGIKHFKLDGRPEENEYVTFGMSEANKGRLEGAIKYMRETHCRKKAY